MKSPAILTPVHGTSKIFRALDLDRLEKYQNWKTIESYDRDTNLDRSLMFLINAYLSDVLDITLIS